VGNDTSTPLSDDTTYAYRQNVHIIYYEPKTYSSSQETTDTSSTGSGESNTSDTSSTNQESKEEDNTTTESQKRNAYNKTNVATEMIDASLLSAFPEPAKSENEYLFNSIDWFVEKYRDSNTTGQGFLDDYNLQTKLNDREILTDYDNRLKVLNGVLCVSVSGDVSASETIDNLTAIITNNGSIELNKQTNSILSVNVTAAQINTDGKIVEAPEGKESSLKTDDHKNIESRYLTYDEKTEDGAYTISLVSLTYGWKGADGNQRSETIFIPVYVEQRIIMCSDLHILEGEQYSYANAHNNQVSYQGNVTVAQDSTYTLYAEFAYSAGRQNHPQRFIAKKLELQHKTGDNNSWEDTNIPAKMKFTLVDVQTGQEYYYTATGDEAEGIEFSAFQDRSGKSYEYRQFGDITITEESYTYTESGTNETKTLTGNFGLEQFYIFVDSTSVQREDRRIYRWSISTDCTEEKLPDTLSFVDRVEYEGIEVTWMPGIEISFLRAAQTADSGQALTKITQVDGQISKKDKVTIDVRINLTANDLYWEERNVTGSGGVFIDSENNNKYLEVAIYLIDRTSQGYVSLPAGTNISLNGEQVHAVTNQSVTYLYKEWGEQFPLSVVGSNITTVQTFTYQGSKFSNYNEIELNFATAQIDDYVGKNYDVYLELRRTSNPNYPLEGSKLDSYSKEVSGAGEKEMAVALEVSDNINLGINTYNETTTDYTIPFTTKIDFTNMIYNTADVEACAAKKYLVTYRLKKKVKVLTRKVVQSETGTESKVETSYKYVNVDQNVSDLTLGKELQLVLQDGDDSSKLKLTTYNGESVYQMVKEFKSDQIEQGTEGTKYLLTWDATLKVSTEGIQNKDLSNYKVEVRVLPYDKDETTPSSDKEAKDALTDYYIFTIGRLKNDL
jgi:hypothetical protein